MLERVSGFKESSLLGLGWAASFYFDVLILMIRLKVTLQLRYSNYVRISVRLTFGNYVIKPCK